MKGHGCGKVPDISHPHKRQSLALHRASAYLAVRVFRRLRAGEDDKPAGLLDATTRASRAIAEAIRIGRGR